jgi:hypothetical protein
MSQIRVNGGTAPMINTGRQLDFWTVSSANVEVNSGAVDSNFERIVREIERVGAVELLGTPASGAFRIAISGSAANASVLTGLVQNVDAGASVAAFVF